MRSEEILFTKGPLDGRTLPVLLGLNGRPPKTYQVPVPDLAGGPPTVHLYRLQAAEVSPRLGLPRSWRYVYESGEAPRTGPRPPWNRVRAKGRKADSAEDEGGHKGVHKHDIDP